MKRIPIVNSNRTILCDDEDYDLLIPYRWHIYVSPSRKGIPSIRAYIKQLSTNVSPLRLMYGQGAYNSPHIFRDRNICNYQRYNIVYDQAFRRRQTVSFYTALHCPHGIAILSNKRSDGRSQLCFECMQYDYDNYYICLDAIAHRTHWKGWRRRGIET